MFLLSHIAHQPCNGIGLCSGVGAGVPVQHIVPVKGNGGQGLDLEAVALVSVTIDRRRRVGGIFPVVEHHRQRGGRATRQAERAVVLRAVVVIGSILVPLGGEHRSDGRRREALLELRLVNDQAGMCLEIFDLGLIGTQPEFHILGHARHVQGTVAIGQNLMGTVVTRDDDKATIAVENVICRQVSTAGIGFGMQQFDISCRDTVETFPHLALHETLGRQLGHGQIHIGCADLHGCHQQGDDEQYSLHKTIKKFS